MGARDSVSRCPRSWSCAEDRSEPIRGWASEDRRSRAARWGAWAPKIRRQFGISHLDRLGLGEHLVPRDARHLVDVPGVLLHPADPLVLTVGLPCPSTLPIDSLLPANFL